MKRPAFQFYPADWRKDSALQSCSLQAQGLWMNLMCIMHECDRYGHLSINEKPMQPVQIARLVGLLADECAALLAELEGAGVFSRLEDGTIYSRRMVKDESLRNIRAEAGKLGGNPALLKQKDNHVCKDKVKQPDNLDVNQSPTPSSSSSSLSSNNNKGANALPSLPRAEILAAYEKSLPASPRVKRWTSTRDKLLSVRWREGVGRDYATREEGIDWWTRFFAYCSESKFLSGQATPTDGRPPFTPNIDWILNASNFAKIEEGTYHRE